MQINFALVETLQILFINSVSESVIDIVISCRLPMKREVHILLLDEIIKYRLKICLKSKKLYFLSCVMGCATQNDGLQI